MAGHSHWANIAFKKGLIDKKRGKLFGKLSRLIIVAAKHGGDPAMNLSLRYAIDRAKKASMPADTIEKAIKKGKGELGADSYDEILYEGYGPGGVAVLCEILTDNRNRTAGEVRRIFQNHGGNLGSTGCVGWMFERKGVLNVPAESITEDRLLELVLEAGADDVLQTGDNFEVRCAPEVYQEVAAALEQAGIATTSSEITRIAANTVELDAENARTVLKLLDALEDNDDVQNVTSNFNISEELMAELANA